MSKVVVAVSGAFDPLCVGHLQHLREAKKLGDKLIVILNGDDFVKRTKGYVLFSADERKKMLMSLGLVDHVHIYESSYNDVIGALDLFRPQIFAKGGDRVPGNVPEEDFCLDKNIKIIYDVGGEHIDHSCNEEIEKIWSGIDADWRNRFEKERQG